MKSVLPLPVVFEPALARRLFVLLDALAVACGAIAAAFLFVEATPIVERFVQTMNASLLSSVYGALP